MRILRSKKGFTLIELLIVIGIIAILATILVLVLNPGELFREARDATRVNDLAVLKKAFNFARLYQDYDQDGPNYPDDSCAGDANPRIFISVPSDNGEAAPDPEPGWTYVQVSTANLYNVDGTGWLPVDFSSAAATVGGTLLSVLPVDPVNTFASGNYYTYTCGSYEVTAALESQKYITEKADEGGDTTDEYEVGNDLAITPARPTATAGQSPLAPTVTGISPNTGVGNGTVNITSITGTRFASGATVKLAKSGETDITGTGFTFTDSTTLSGGSFDVNGATASTWDVVVTNSDGQSGTLTNGFTVTSPPLPAPTVSSINPTSVNKGTTGQVITITGTNFANGATASFSGGGITVTNASFVNSTTLDVTIDVAAGAAGGARNVTVTNPDLQSDTGVGLLTVASTQLDTGYILPSSHSFTSGHSSYYVLPASPYVDDNPPASTSDIAQAVDVTSSTVWPNIFLSGYNFNIPAGSTIDGICVNVDGVSQETGTSSTQRWRVTLSWNGGTSLTAANNAAPDFSNTTLNGLQWYFKDATTAPATSDPGTTCTNWGRTWTDSELSSGNFAVRMTAINQSATAATLRFDTIKVKVYYTP